MTNKLFTRTDYAGRNTQELVRLYTDADARSQRTETGDETMDEIFIMQEIAAVLVDRGVELP